MASSKNSGFQREEARLAAGDLHGWNCSPDLEVTTKEKILNNIKHELVLNWCYPAKSDSGNIPPFPAEADTGPQTHPHFGTTEIPHPVGVIVTRMSELQDLFNNLAKGASYGQSTTHWRKLIPKVDGGGSSRITLHSLTMYADHWVNVSQFPHRFYAVRT